MRSIRSISHLSWNIEGLGNKLYDKCVIDKIRKHHIVALLETHGNAHTHIAIECYYTYQANRPKSGKKLHGSIAILVKQELRPGIKFYPAQSSDLLWTVSRKNFSKCSLTFILVLFTFQQ